MTGRARGPTTRAALIALALASASIALPPIARAQPQIRLPECGPTTHLDRLLLADLLRVELGEDEVTVELDAALCDPGASHVELTVTTASGIERERLVVLGDDPAERARSLALVIAERVHLLTLPGSASPADAEAPEEDAATDGSASDPSSLPDAPRAMFVAAPVVEPPAPPATPPIALPPTVEVVALARLAPILPTGAIGVRSEVHAHADRYWSLSLGVAATWSHAELDALRPHVLIGAISGSVGWTPYRDRFFDVLIAARGAIGAALVGGAGLNETARPWATLGADTSLLLWPHPTLGVVLGMGVSGVIAGTTVSSTLAQPILQLSGLVLDATLGFRVPLE